MKRILRNNGLSIAIFTIFFILLFLHSITGYAHYNDEQRDHQQPEISYGEYVRTSSFAESVYENWESEFLQMGVYILFTVRLFQRGSAESKDPDKIEAVDRDPDPKRPGAPWPVRRGGLLLMLYKRSLFGAFLLMFLISFALHAGASRAEYCKDQATHGQAECPALIQYLGNAQFWFESFQNWQSEFLAVGSIVVLSVYLRQHGSPESKPVDAPHHATGEA